MKKLDIVFLFIILLLSSVNLITKNNVGSSILKNEIASYRTPSYSVGEPASIKESDMKKEIFKDIIGYEGRYQASDLGRIKSLKRVVVDSRNIRILKERILKPGINTGSYLYVGLYRNNKCKNLLVHRLILFTFKGKSDLETNHINCIKTDNRIENLEYITHSENAIHAYKNGLYKNIKKIDQFDLQGKHIRLFDSMMDVERQLGIAQQSISACCLGIRKTAGKFKWRFNNL